MTSKECLLANVVYIVAQLETREPLTEDAGQLDDGYGLSDWVSDSALDIVYRINSDGSYLGAEVTVAVGGPTVWIDTQRQVVHGSWGHDRYERDYDDSVGLDDYMGEIWEGSK